MKKNTEMPKECIDCPGNKCTCIGLRCNNIPVSNPRLQPLLEWRKAMCSKVEMKYDRGALICSLDSNIIHIRGSWDIGCGHCPYG